MKKILLSLLCLFFCGCSNEKNIECRKIENAKKKIELLSSTWDDKKYFNSANIMEFCGDTIMVTNKNDRIMLINLYVSVVKDFPALEKYPFDSNYYYARYNFFKIGVCKLFDLEDTTSLLLWMENWVEFYKSLIQDKIRYKKILTDLHIDYEALLAGKINESKILPFYKSVPKIEIRKNTSPFVNRNRYVERRYTYGDCNRYFAMFKKIDFFVNLDFVKSLPSVYHSIKKEQKHEFVRLYQMIWESRPKWIPKSVWQSTENH